MTNSSPATAPANVPGSPETEAASSRWFLSSSFLVMADQCVVSAANFAMVVVLTRLAGESTLGDYTLVYSLLVLGVGVHTALLLGPYTVYWPRESAEGKLELSGSVLRLSIYGSFVAGGLLWLVSYFAGYVRLELQWTVAMLGAMLPLVVLRNLVRRVCFAQLRFDRALILDVLATVLRFSIVVAALSRDRLTATVALASIAISDVLIAAFFLLRYRSEWSYRHERIRLDAIKCWSFGRWTALSQTVFISHTYSVHWILAITCEKSVIGVYMMCSSLVQLASPLIQGIGNGLTPALSRSVARGDGSTLAPLIRRFTVLIGGIAVAYGLAMIFLSGPLLAVIYGDVHEKYEGVLIALSLGVAVTLAGLPAAKGLTVLEKTKANFLINLASLVVAVILAFGFARNGNLVGAATGVCIGYVLAAVLRWATFLHFKKAMPGN